jgi:hypothetical protein
MALVCDARDGLPVNFINIRTPVIIELEFMASNENFLNVLECWSTKKDGIKYQMMTFRNATRTRSMKAWAADVLQYISRIDSWVAAYRTSMFDDYITSIRSTEWTNDLSVYSIKTGLKIMTHIVEINAWLDSITRNLHQIRNAALLREATYPTPTNRVLMVWSGTALNEVDNLGGHLDTHANRIETYVK